MNNLRIAVAQFPVTSSPGFNMNYIGNQTREAADRGADIVHFPETALSGYDTITDAEAWAQLYEYHDELRSLARESAISMVVGTQFESGVEGKPFNVTLVISKNGEIIGAYHKSSLYGKENERFSKRDNALVLDIEGVRCGFLICYDSCFPSLFQAYQDQDVEVLFLSYYNAGNTGEENSLDDLMLAQIRTRAADYGFYISGSNSSKPHSRLASGVASPDGSYDRLRRHAIGIHVCDLPKDELGWTHHHER